MKTSIIQRTSRKILKNCNAWILRTARRQHLSDDKDEYLDEEAETDYEDRKNEKSNRKKARQIYQFFVTILEGDFTWPVAAFPVYSVTAEKVDKNILWPLVRALDKVPCGKIIIAYGVCDGRPWNSKLFD